MLLKKLRQLRVNEDLPFSSASHKLSFKKSAFSGFLYPSPIKVTALMVLKYPSMPLYKIYIIFMCIMKKMGWSYTNTLRQCFLFNYLRPFSNAIPNCWFSLVMLRLVYLQAQPRCFFLINQSHGFLSFWRLYFPIVILRY